jgi:hypothetical protein
VSESKTDRRLESLSARVRSLALAAASTIALGTLATGIEACSGGGSDTGSALDSANPVGAGGSGGTSSGSAGTSNGQPASGGSSTGTASGGSAGTVLTGEPPPPPEMELESAFQAPVATDRYVWTANPTTGNVALIGADDLSVRLAEAGVAPTTVAALPGSGDEDAAIVLNAGSNDATILRLGADGVIVPTTVKTQPGANAVAVSPLGKWAIVWTNAALLDASTLDPTDGLQEVTVVSLAAEPRATGLSVGYRPSQVSFDASEERAFLVTEEGMTVVDLGDTPTPASQVALTEDPIADPAARDVSVTPDGKYAVVRVEGQKALRIVNLSTSETQTVELGDYVTDLDLSVDGSEAFAVAGGALVVVPVPPGNADPGTFAHASATGEVARSVSLSPDASLALLYSNATDDPYLGILSGSGDWSNYQGRAVDLKAPVRAVFAAPDAQHGVAFQSTATGSSKAGAFSLVSAQSDRAPKIIGTDAAPFSLAFAPDGSTAVITTRDLTKKSYGMYLVHLASLEQTFIPLSSPPLAAGIVPHANRAFVAQAHPEGRITFVDLDDGSQHTLTGFELTAKVTQ